MHTWHCSADHSLEAYATVILNCLCMLGCLDVLVDRRTGGLAWAFQNHPVHHKLRQA